MGIVKNGFVTALGTPLDKNGNVVESSLRRHLRQQIDVGGASALLLMGTMGREAALTLEAFNDVARIACDEVNGEIPLFIGAMDTSIAKVKQKINLIKDYKFDGIVLTVPYYFTVNDEKAINWFSELADFSPIPVYVYDHLGITQYKININVISKLITHKNIRGMKSVDWELIKKIERKFPEADFECFYSGLDNFDYANQLGITKNLDGMFCCTPKNGRKMYDCMQKKDYDGARKYLDKILFLRDEMIATGRLMACFTYCMNLLGCDGIFHDDYEVDASVEQKAYMEKLMKQIGEI